ncbi:MAG TPA: acetate--CoA ligase family protein [Rhizobiaceae bacterium]|nr:acetate--CoA ligase family protein [Rhizobiaceae bacterium]
MVHRLDPLLKPLSIALVGASRRPSTPGNTMVRAVATDGYGGRVYPINPKYDEVEGFACYPDLASLPEQVDHVVLGLGNEQLESGLRDAVSHGAKAVTIFASCDVTGTPDDGLADRLIAIAREAGIVMCGGNCMGFSNPGIGLRVVGYAGAIAMKPGGIAFITQSGSAFGALAYNDPRLKFSLCVSSGREFTTTAADYLDWTLDQPETRVVGLFLETARDPARFAQALERADGLGIPIVALKIGRTPLSAHFAAGHSGAIAGDNAAYEALFSKWGVMSVDTLDQLAANLLLFSAGRPAAVGGLASLHDSGGEREMVADLAAAHGVPFGAISGATLDRLKPHLDSGLKPANPLDVWGSGRDFEHHVEACMDAMLDDPAVAMGALFQDVRDDSYVASGFARAIVASARKTTKPVLIATNFASSNHRALALATSEAGVPVIDGTEEALNAVRNMFGFRDRHASEKTWLSGVADAVRQRWRHRLANGQPMDEAASLSLLGDYGIAIPRMAFVRTLAEARSVAEEIGFPVALKTAAEGISHKTDQDGVRLGIDEKTLTPAYTDLAGRLGPQMIVAEMAPKGVEIAFGMVRDPQFGPYVVAASGGTWIEMMKDRALRLPPLSLQEAEAMISELRINPLLDGMRGMPPADRAAITEALARFSMMAADLGDLIDEMDVNPLLASARGCMAVDALVIPAAAGKTKVNSEGNEDALRT